MINRIVPPILILLLLGGCGLLNPYRSDFQCPKGDTGKCVSIPDAYQESKQKTSKKLIDELTTKPEKNEQRNKEYRQALYAELTRLLREPVTPMVVPPRAMRVLILPYRDDQNRLHMPRYTYYFVDEPRWVVDSSAAVKEQD